MPEYVYQCRECGYKFKKIHKIEEVIQISCPYCGGTNTGRIPQPFAFSVKIMDAGQRKAREISHYLESKRDKARVEAGEYSLRKAMENGKRGNDRETTG